MMGGQTARNMYSADNNKEHCISCILLVMYNTHLAMHGSMNIKFKCSKFFVNNKDNGMQHKYFLRIWYVLYSNHGLKTNSYNSGYAWYYSVTTGKYLRGTSY
jgi:hypothetical protein